MLQGGFKSDWPRCVDITTEHYHVLQAHINLLIARTATRPKSTQPTDQEVSSRNSLTSRVSFLFRFANETEERLIIRVHWTKVHNLYCLHNRDLLRHNPLPPPKPFELSPSAIAHLLLLLALSSGTVYLLTSSLLHHSQHYISSETENTFIPAIIPRHCLLTASPQWSLKLLLHRPL